MATWGTEALEPSPVSLFTSRPLIGQARGALCRGWLSHTERSTTAQRASQVLGQLVGDRVDDPFDGGFPVPFAVEVPSPGIGDGVSKEGSSYDNALAESIIGLYKTELIKKQRPWKGFDDLEIATAEWVDWFNHRRPFEYCGDLTPVEAEAAHYAHHQTPAAAGVSK